MIRQLLLALALLLACSTTRAQQQNFPGSSSGSSSPAPIVGYYLGSACLPANTGQCFYSPADTQQVNDCSWTSGSKNVACATSHFVASDVGKQVMGWKTCAAFINNTDMGANAVTAQSLTTIATVTDATHIILNANAENTQAASTGCFIWGHPDDTYAQTLETAYTSAPFCPRIILAAAYYMFSKPHFYTTPTACAAEGLSFGNVNPGFGNVFYSGGFELEGRGVGPTTIFLTPNFPNGDTCARGPSLNACFVIPTMGRWKDFQLTGGSSATIPALPNSKALIYGDVVSIDNFTCTNLGAFDASNSKFGIVLGWQTQLYQYNNSGCGSIGMLISSGQGVVTCIKCRIENSNTIDLEIGGPSGTFAQPSFTCYDCAFYNSQGVTGLGPIDILNHGGWVLLYHAELGTGGASSAGITGYKNVVAGGRLDSYNTVFSFSNGSATNSAIVCTAACTNALENTRLTSQASGFDVQDVANSNLIDLGGNTVTPRFSIGGSVTGDMSISGTTITSAKLVLSGGWGASAAWTALVGQTRRIQGTITNTGAGQAANPTITYTFPTAFWSTSNLVCSAQQVGGTQGAILNTFTPSALTATGVTFTYNGTPTVNLTEIVQIDCGVK